MGMIMFLNINYGDDLMVDLLPPSVSEPPVPPTSTISAVSPPPAKLQKCQHNPEKSISQAKFIRWGKLRNLDLNRWIIRTDKNKDARWKLMDRTNWISNGFLSFKIQNFIHVIQKTWSKLVGSHDFDTFVMWLFKFE